MADLWAFFCAVAGTWTFWFGMVLMIEPSLEGAWPRTYAASKALFAKHPKLRQTIFRRLGAILLLFACFQAWHSEYSAHAELTQQMQAKRDRSAITNQLKQFYADGAVLLADRNIKNQLDVLK